MRKCYKCKIEKEESEFHKDRTQIGGISYDCKKCKSEIRKQKRKENPEKYREACRISTLKNYETIRASQKKHRIKNRDKILKRRRELREPRKDELNAKENERRKKDPNYLEKNRERYKKYYAKNKEKMLPKHNAHKLVMYAIRLGLMRKGTECILCGSSKQIEGHHEDYSKPLEVQWLCRKCHAILHKKKF